MNLFFEVYNGELSSEALKTIATWPRIRWLKLGGCDFSEPIDDATSEALDSLVGRVESLQMNTDDLDHPPTRVHESFEPYFEKIRENGHLARRKPEGTP